MSIIATPLEIWPNSHTRRKSLNVPITFSLMVRPWIMNRPLWELARSLKIFSRRLQHKTIVKNH